MSRHNGLQRASRRGDATEATPPRHNIFNKKRQLSPSLVLASLVSHSLPTVYRLLGKGILTFFPFGNRCRRAPRRTTSHHFVYSFRCCLRIDSLPTNYSSWQTLTHFDPKVSHFCSCYYIQDLHYWQLQLPSQAAFDAINTHAYSTKTSRFFVGRV